TKNRNKMVSMLQNVKAMLGWQKHQLVADFDENERPVPDKFKRRASLNSLNTIRMSLRKRLPLKQVELNFCETSAWESMEARKKGQTLQSITRTARNAFATVSQKIHTTCQSPVVTFPAEPAGCAAKKRSATPQPPCHN
ncbi:PIMRE protein, partial [Alectura lathami]|nr:PIMRE protein [Alectura lathami]